MSEHTRFENVARYYDLFELKSHRMYVHILDVLEDHFSRHNVQCVLDVACGTGAQAVPLARKGYRVTACDIAEDMLAIARGKSADLNIHFVHGDMRSTAFELHDAAIAMLNSVGYLTRSDFLTSLDNIRRSVRPGGLFAFDNTNLDAISAGVFSEGQLIDTAGDDEGTRFVRFTRSTLDSSGMMTINWEAHVQHGFQHLETYRGTWHRQTYAVDELNRMLNEQGFRVLEYRDRYGAHFDKRKTFALMIIAEVR